MSPGLGQREGDKRGGSPAHLADLPIGRANLIGMGFSVASGASFQVANAIVRFLSADLQSFELVFFRNFFGVLLLAPVMVKNRFRVLETRRLGFHLLRATVNFGAISCIFFALALEPLAKVVSLSFTVQLFATAGAVLFLGEKIYARRVIALCAGFAGMLIILRPGIISITAGTLFTLAYVVIWAAGLLMVKLLARTESAMTQTSYAALFQTPMALACALFFWRWPEWHHYIWFAALALCGSVAQFTLSQAFRYADAGLALSVDYLKLVWAALIGFLWFNEVPDLWTWVGAGVICLSVSYITQRERVAGKRAAAAGR